MQPLDHDYLRTESSVFSVLIADGLSSLVSLEYLDLRVRNYLPLMPKDEVIFSSHSSAVSWISQDNQISDLSEIAKLAPVSGCLSGAGGNQNADMRPWTARLNYFIHFVFAVLQVVDAHAPGLRVKPDKPRWVEGASKPSYFPSFTPFQSGANTIVFL